RCAVSDFGAGTDGALTVPMGTTTTITIDTTAQPASGSSGTTALTVASATGFAAGQVVLVHQTQGPMSGQWDFGQIASVSGTTLTLTSPLLNGYSSTGGPNNHAQAILVPQYTDVSVAAGGTLIAPAWNGATGGILVFKANGTTTIGGTVSMAGH